MLIHRRDDAVAVHSDEGVAIYNYAVAASCGKVSDRWVDLAFVARFETEASHNDVSSPDEDGGKPEERPSRIFCRRALLCGRLHHARTSFSYITV